MRTSPTGRLGRARLVVVGLIAGLGTALVPALAPTAPTAGAQVGGSSNAAVGTAFYTPPAELPAEPGAVIRTEPMPFFPSVPDLAGGALPAEAQRIMYRSTGAAGGPIAVTGTYLQPKTPWAGPGPRPLAVVTPGTQGQGDQCAPSRSMTVGLAAQTDPPSLAAGYSVIDALPLINEGFAVVVTDYAGLGTPGHHPYINRDSQGRAALDAARAALRLPGTDLAPDSKTVVTGYSQGGGAAAAMGELQPTYAPEIDLVGIAAGAPPSAMIDTLARVDGGLLTGAVGYAINGIEEIHPHTRPAFDRLLNDEGRRMVQVTAGQCVAETALTYGLWRTSAFTRDGRPLSEAVQSEPEIMRILDGYDLGTVAPQAPAMVIIGRNDDVVPHHTAVDLARQWCTQGTPVELRTTEVPAVAPGLVVDHAIPMITEALTGARYLKDRVLGLPAPSSCGTL
ncbi:lipase family protein [Dietzia sp. CH92]|uniref:lipase family protein n=1 Tax=Dietzia sp. CH92 TaxID=3051823 RepID=UPI0028D82949|nr:lipase family protein [Dietzia sp. CH92]